MKLNKPNVIIVIGREKICKTGLTDTLTIDRTILAPKAVQTLLTVNPGIKYANAIKIIELIAIFFQNPIRNRSNPHLHLFESVLLLFFRYGKHLDDGLNVDVLVQVVK